MDLMTGRAEGWSFDDDLKSMFARLAPDWPGLKGASIFMTGGTGFIGRWMLEALRDANQKLDLGVRMTVLTRDPAAYAARVPHIASCPAFTFVAGDVCSFDAPDDEYSHVIHAATDASADLNARDPRRMFDTIVGGTRNMLDLAHERAPQGRFLFLSSGAVYGAQPREITHVDERYPGSPDCLEPKNAYGEGKRAAEMLCAIYGKQFGLDVVNARIFALLGPLLSLDIHFAAGNFIRDALCGRPIRVEGAGTAVRSYLYAADLAVWLWTMLLRADRGMTYNVGSEDAVSVADLARKVSTVLGGGEVEILGKPDQGWNPGRYVPSCRRIRDELGVAPEVDLDEAIRRTAIANGWKK